MKKQPLPPSTQAAAVITGAGSGIGRSFAYEVARRGGSVLCVDIDAERAEQVASNLRALGNHAIAQQCDVGDQAQMESLADMIMSRVAALVPERSRGVYRSDVDQKVGPQGDGSQEE